MTGLRLRGEGKEVSHFELASMKAIVFSRQHHGEQGKASETKARVSGQEYFGFDIRKKGKVYCLS